MSSPGEFLTFYRRMPSSLTRARLLPRPVFTKRAITYTAVARADASGPDIGEGKPHVLDKKNKLDAQSDASNTGREDHAKGTGSSAHKGEDERNSAAKAKAEHPEAPDAHLGFQDERGGKGY